MRATWFQHPRWLTIQPFTCNVRTLRVRVGDRVNLTIVCNADAEEVTLTGEVKRLSDGRIKKEVTGDTAMFELGIASRGSQTRTTAVAEPGDFPMYATAARHPHLRLVVTVPVGTTVEIERI